MNLNVTVDPAVDSSIASNVEGWVNQTAEWSSLRYPSNDYESRLEIIVDTLPDAWKVSIRTPTSRINLGQISVVRWTYEAQKKFYLTQLFYDVSYQVGIQTALASCLSYFVGIKGTEEQQAAFDPAMSQQQEQLEWLQFSQPELIASWIDRSNSLSDHVAGLRKEHWRFPSLNPKLCRYGRWGEGAVFPEGSGR